MKRYDLAQLRGQHVEHLILFYQAKIGQSMLLCVCVFEHRGCVRMDKIISLIEKYFVSVILDDISRLELCDDSFDERTNNE